ncbi:MAG TPA: hypothetical protein VN282_23830 [Pyrinomonadaceae bacterium]|nr:hypothetical protein [Pyrinomonadaceae bacterium]
MRLLSILQARTVAFLEVDELFTRHHILGPEFTPKVAERYGFLKVPEKLEDFLDEQKGIQFAFGRWEGTVINQLALYAHGIAVETAASTDISEKILHDMLKWGANTLNINYHQDMIKRRAYVSGLLFSTEVSLNALHPKLRGVGERLSTSVANSLGHVFPYEVTGVFFGYDTTHTKPNAPIFTIERRADVPFSENKYFSTAPLPTDEHLRLLKDFEAALKE